MYPQSSTETCVVSGGAVHPLVSPFDRTELLCTSFLQEQRSQEQILAIPGVLCITKLAKSSQKTEGKCMSTYLTKFIYIMYF